MDSNVLHWYEYCASFKCKEKHRDIGIILNRSILTRIEIYIYHERGWCYRFLSDTIR